MPSLINRSRREAEWCNLPQQIPLKAALKRIEMVKVFYCGSQRLLPVTNKTGNQS
jgi:hypothetical protein